MLILRYVMAALVLYSTVLTILQIGKTRKPLTPGVAAAVVVVNSVLIVALLA